jgi:hypothetical protein
VLFDAEPARTYDLDVFVLLAPADGSPIMTLESICSWARHRQFKAEDEPHSDSRSPVQFLPAHNLLAEEAVVTARTLDERRSRCKPVARDAASGRGNCSSQGMWIGRPSGARRAASVQPMVAMRSV